MVFVFDRTHKIFMKRTLTHKDVYIQSLYFILLAVDQGFGNETYCNPIMYIHKYML